MSKKPRVNRPYIRPVTKIQLSQTNVKLRLILIAVFLAIAVIAIGYGFYTALNVQPGWNMVTVSSQKPNCGSEFNLMYDFSEAGGSAGTVNKNLSAFYTRCSEEGFALFSADLEGEGNLYQVNAHVNEAVAVEPELYDAFTLLEAYDSRLLYLAPVYAEYDRVFRGENDAEAQLYDPLKNPEILAYVDTVMAFVRDPESIHLELLGENTVKLTVSEDYLAFAQAYGIEKFLEFGWIRNAFLADYIADRLAQQGFTRGYLASYDGFTRNLDARGGEFAFNLFDRRGNTIWLPAEFVYSGPMSIVFLRDHPMVKLDQWHYHAYENGDITTSMLDPETGIPKASISDLTVYSQNLSCAELLLNTLPVYFGDSFEVQKLNAMTAEGLFALWCENGVVYHNDPDARIRTMSREDGEIYGVAFAG